VNQSELLAQVRRIQVRTNRMVTDVMAGGYTSVFRGSGIEFDEVREFTEGDDIRAVDWNVTARTGRPHVKKYMEERELSVLFLLDVSASTGFGTAPGARAGDVPTVRRAAATFCACLALAAARNNDKAGLITFSDRIEGYVPAKKGKAHVLRIIRDALAHDAQGRATDLGRALDYAGRVQRKRAVVFVISDFLTPHDIGQPLRLLARRHDVIAAQIVDQSTLALPRAGLLAVRDLETGASRWLDTSSARVRAAWAEQMQQQQVRLVETMKRSGVDRMEIVLRGVPQQDQGPGKGQVERAVGDAIVRFFRMREVRGGRR
jgi:uncharacterized protein (DUF58 family)